MILLVVESEFSDKLDNEDKEDYSIVTSIYEHSNT